MTAETSKNTSAKTGKKTKFDQVDLANLALKHDQKGTQAQHFDMRIDAMGQWYHQGGLIKRQALVKLFANVLTKLSDGQYWLITPAERGVIEVEDAPFFVNRLDVSGSGQGQQITLTTTLDDAVVLGAGHPLRVSQNSAQSANGQPRPYVSIRGDLEALIARSVFYELAELAVEEDGRFGVWSDGMFHLLD